MKVLFLFIPSNLFSATFLLTPNHFDISTIKTIYCPQVAVCQRISGNSHEDHTQNALLCRTNASNNRLSFFYNPLGCIYVINNTRILHNGTVPCFMIWKKDYVLTYPFCSQAIRVFSVFLKRTFEML